MLVNIKMKNDWKIEKMLRRKQKKELKERFKPLRALTRKFNKIKEKAGADQEKVKVDLEKQIKNWLKQDTPKFLEELKKKNTH
jgi:hypothetical protein